MTAAAPAAVALAPALARRVTARWHHVALAGILGVAAVLNFVRLDQNGYANTYYAAAVRSMLASWHNFFYVSFDPGGLVSVDKPPLALWVQAASAKLFGYSGFTLLLPEALAGVAAVWLLYLAVARVFGRVAGLVAAVALAVSPVSVAVNRDNNPDALFAFLLVASAYFGIRAVQSGRLRWLVVTAVTVGLAFNTKMLAALIVVPALGAAYMFFSPNTRRARAAHLALAGAVLLAVGGAWIAAVDLTPASNRPYVGSTTTNTARGLALDYNGVGRITGQTGGTSSPGGLGGAFSGSPGPLRLINDALGDQGGWLLPLAIVGGLSALLAAALARRRRDLGALTILGGWFLTASVVFSFAGGIIHTYYLSALAPASSALVGLGTVALWRDAKRGRFWVALPLAAMGIGAWLEVELLRRSGYLPWLQALVIAGVVVAALPLVALAVPGFAPARVRAAGATAALVAGVACLLAAPAAWAATTFKVPVNGVFPGAGPTFVSGLGGGAGGVLVFGGTGGGQRFDDDDFGGDDGGPQPPGFGGAPPIRGGGFGGPPPVLVGPGGGRFGPRRGGGFPGAGGSGNIESALAYANAHDPGSRWSLIVSSEQEAATYVVRGEAVAAMGGFTGRETVLTSSYLARLVGSGEARYFLIGQTRGGPFGNANAAADIITSACRKVPSVSGLYDCSGRAARIAAAG